MPRSREEIPCGTSSEIRVSSTGWPTFTWIEAGIHSNFFALSVNFFTSTPKATFETDTRARDAMAITVRNDLGGLAPQPLTFTEGAESNPHISCYFTMQTKNHKITSPSGMKPVCVQQT